MRFILKLIKNLFKILLSIVVLILFIQLVVLGVGRVCLKSDMEDLKPADCILVLGTSVNPDGTPGSFLRERLDTAVELYYAGYSDKLLLTGDNGQVDYNEVEAMKRYALNAGVPAEDIFLDHAGFSTYESMYRAKNIFEVESAIVVTQKFHENRALYSGTVLGMKVQGYAAEDVQSTRPRALMIREFLAREKDFFMAILRIKPTYLGEPISIHGDGTISWS